MCQVEAAELLNYTKFQNVIFSSEYHSLLNTIVSTGHPIDLLKYNKHNQITRTDWIKVQKLLQLRDFQKCPVVVRMGSIYGLNHPLPTVQIQIYQYSSILLELVRKAKAAIGHDYDCAHIRTGSSGGWDGVKFGTAFRKKMDLNLNKFVQWSEKRNQSRALIVISDDEGLVKNKVKTNFTMLTLSSILPPGRGNVYSPGSTVYAASSMLLCAHAKQLFLTQGSTFSRCVGHIARELKHVQ